MELPGAPSLLAHYALPNASPGDGYLVGFYGGDETFVVQTVLVELGQLFVALGGDGFTLGVGLHHDIHGPPYGHARDHLLQHGDDVLHRRVVVVVQYDFVRGLLGDAALYLYPRLRLGRRRERDRYAMQRWCALHFHLRIAELVYVAKYRDNAECATLFILLNPGQHFPCDLFDGAKVAFRYL